MKFNAWPSPIDVVVLPSPSGEGVTAVTTTYRARGLSASDVSTALQHQNVILPSGDVKIGDKDYTLAMNNTPDVIDTINSFPIKQVAGRMVFMRDVAHVHDGFQVQTNSVSVNGTPGALMVIRKTGGVSTLAVIDGVRAALKDLANVLPKGVTIKALFDQSVFVKAALDSVLLSASMAAALTAMVIILFLGNVRLSLIILAAIPLSIITSVLFIDVAGQTLNTMTLGGFALAIGILVDNGTVVIENIERHVAMREPLHQAIVNGASEVAVPTLLSTLCICIVFVPVFLLQGTAKYLFSPLSLSVIGALLASLVLSFTMVPVLFNFLMAKSVHRYEAEEHHRAIGQKRHSANPLVNFQQGFERKFEEFREGYRNILSWALSQPVVTVTAFVVLMVLSALLFPQLGRDFFPQVDAGQMRLHVRAPPGTRIERTQQYFGQVAAEIRRLVGNGQIDVMLDNIGLPYSGINIALSDSATVGPMDGEILISLTKKHTPTAALIAMLRRELPARFAQLQFFFQPADIVDQVLNFGQPAPIDIRVSGPDQRAAFGVASDISKALVGVPGVVDSHVFQVRVDHGLDGRYRPLARHPDRYHAAWGGQRRADRHQLERADGPQLLGRSAQQRELPAGGAIPALPVWVYAGPQDPAGQRRGAGRQPAAVQSGGVRPRYASVGRLAAQHPPCLRRPGRRAGARLVLCGARHRQGHRRTSTGCREGDQGSAERPD